MRIRRIVLLLCSKINFQSSHIRLTRPVVRLQGFFTAMGIRDYVARKRSAPSSPKVRVIGGKGSDAGMIRHELYKADW